MRQITIELLNRLPEMTNQQAQALANLLGQVTRGFEAQNWAPSRDKGTCQYRGPDGLKCGIGHLIPDNLNPLVPGIEGKGVFGVMAEDSLIAKYLQALNPGFEFNLWRELLLEVQGCHDDAEDLEAEWTEFVDSIPWPEGFKP